MLAVRMVSARRWRSWSREALAAVPPRQRTALALRYVFDLAEEDVAAALGCRPGTAASLLSRGRERLRRDAAEDGPPTTAAATNAHVLRAGPGSSPTELVAVGADGRGLDTLDVRWNFEHAPVGG